MQGESPDELLASVFEIDVTGRRVPATASLMPLHDPRADRVKA